MYSELAARQTWLTSPLAQELVAAEAELLGGMLDDVFGLEMLQLGCWGPAGALIGASRTRRQTIVDETAKAGEAGLRAHLSALPVQPASVDAVLLPHTLEFDRDPQAIVREADRVLTGEGQLIVLGFKPFSLWGLRAAASDEGFPPGIHELLPEARVRDWLALLGYEVVQSRHYLYSRPWQRSRAPLGNRRMLRRGFLNPLPAGAYAIKARKHVYRPTLIRPRWRQARPQVLAGLVEPTRRNES
jgi:SAM-dependent methyltransferase